MADKATGTSGKAVFHPVSSVTAVIEQPDEAQAALEALHTAGFSENAVAVVCGPSGTSRIVVEPGRFGLLNRVARMLHAEQKNALSLTVRQAAAVEEGHLCICVRVDTDEEREAARQTLKAHGGQFITYHGLNESTGLDE